MGDGNSDIDFSYSPLESTQPQIRLIRLQPQDPTAWQTTVDCEIVHVNLNEGPVYECLSYVWGSENKPYKIRVNGKALGITLNLFSALVHLRGSEPRNLWIDAICIDQNSVHERNHQVAMMQDIFSKAARTTIWLGDFSFIPIDGSRSFLRHIEQAYEAEPLEHEKMAGSEGVTDIEFVNFQRILACAWFTRIWVIQELACSHVVTVRVGMEEISWDALFWWTLRLADTEPSGSQLDGPSIEQRIIALDRERANYRTKQLTPLLSLIFNLADCEATDRRDKVYALLGIAAGQEDAGMRMPVNYQSSFSGMVVALARSHVLSHNPLRLTLPEAGTDGDRSVTDEVASWLKAYPLEDGPLAPLQRSWLISGPISPDHHINVTAEHLHGFHLTTCDTPLGSLQVLYASGTTWLLALVEATDGTFRLLDALSISAGHADHINTSMMRLSKNHHPRHPHQYATDKEELWVTIILPLFYEAAKESLADSHPGGSGPWRCILDRWWTDGQGGLDDYSSIRALYQ